MKVIGWLLGVLLLLGVAFGALMYAGSESGEVVVLHTTDDAGAQKETRIWVVDVDGKQWLRSGSPTSGWLTRLRAHPSITVERGGHAAEYTAAPTPAMQEQVNAAMAAKYGWADKLVHVTMDARDAVPVELIPRTNAAP